MKYFYYPGCSLDGTAREYDRSTRAVMRALDIELMEVEDWTCCGASAAEAQSHLLSLALPARNLALVERTKIGADLLAPCSACYLNLKRAEDHLRRDERLCAMVNEALGEEGLRYRGGIRVRHLLDILAMDIGPARLEARVESPLTGLRIAPYYGCQCLRPYTTFDDPERPVTMEPLIESLGAQAHPWSMGARCCGAGLMTTKKEVALERVGDLLSAATGADCIATVCPMCQMNLESFQSKAPRPQGEKSVISVLYLPQLIALAFGLPKDEAGLSLNFALTASLLEKLAGRSRV